MELKDLKPGKLSRPMQLTLFALLMIVLAGAFYYFLLQGPLQERSQLRDEVGELGKSVQQGAAVAAQFNQFKKELAELEKKLTVLRGILPSEKETPQVLRNAQDMAFSSSLKITRFNPQPVLPHPFYSDWPILIEVRGSYNALGSFFEKISRATRIVNVDNLAAKGIDGSTDPAATLTASCTVTTFVYREEATLPDAKPAPGKPAAKAGKK
jgi:type IV pilus assembly protein PilO